MGLWHGFFNAHLWVAGVQWYRYVLGMEVKKCVVYNNVQMLWKFHSYIVSLIHSNTAYTHEEQKYLVISLRNSQSVIWVLVFPGALMSPGENTAVFTATSTMMGTDQERPVQFKGCEPGNLQTKPLSQKPHLKRTTVVWVTSKWGWVPSLELLMLPWNDASPFHPWYTHTTSRHC